MKNIIRKEHWDNIYQNKQLSEVSWYQPVPQTSLDFIADYNLSKNSKIIDIGGEDSFLVDHLLAFGYQDITVLDISELAIDRAKKRLGADADKVRWIASDVTEFHSTEQYDFWHDRATFHFLTDQNDIHRYINTANQSINPTGYMMVGTFSENGPKKCSGIDIKQYSETSLADQMQEHFEKILCSYTNHLTPSGTIQNFVFCAFRKSER